MERKLVSADHCYYVVGLTIGELLQHIAKREALQITFINGVSVLLALGDSDAEVDRLIVKIREAGAAPDQQGWSEEAPS